MVADFLNDWNMHGDGILTFFRSVFLIVCMEMKWKVDGENKEKKYIENRCSERRNTCQRKSTETNKSKWTDLLLWIHLKDLIGKVSGNNKNWCIFYNVSLVFFGITVTADWCFILFLIFTHHYNFTLQRSNSFSFLPHEKIIERDNHRNFRKQKFSRYAEAIDITFFVIDVKICREMQTRDFFCRIKGHKFVCERIKI